MDSELTPIDDAAYISTEITSDINSIPALEVTDAQAPAPEPLNQPVPPQNVSIVQTSFGRAHAGLPMVQTIVNN